MQYNIFMCQQFFSFWLLVGMRSMKKEFKEGLYLVEKSDEAVYGLADA